MIEEFALFTEKWLGVVVFATVVAGLLFNCWREHKKYKEASHE